MPVNNTSPEYFGSGAVPYVAGDACIAPPTSQSNPPLQTQIILNDTVTNSQSQVATVTPVLQIKNPASVSIMDLGYSPSVDNKTSNGYSSISNIFDYGGVPSRNQHGIWTWYAEYADFNSSYQSGDVTVPPTSFQETYATTSSSGTTCTYPYTVTVSSTLQALKNAQLPFDYQVKGSAGSFQASVLPYFRYNYNLGVPSVPSKINLNLSYDIYGPLTYSNPQSNIDPFPLNTSSYFFANKAQGNSSQSSSTSVRLTAYYLNSISAQQGYLSLGYPLNTSPIINSQAGSLTTTTESTGACPDQSYQGDPNTQLTFQQVVACAQQAGWTGTNLEVIVSIADAESGFHPGEVASIGPLPGGACYSTGCPSGLLQSSPTGGYGSCINTPQAFNPLCTMQWGMSEYLTSSDSFAGYWQTYTSGAYCQYMPTSYSGQHCSHGGGQLPWGSVGTSPSTTSVTSTQYAITAQSMATTPNNYIYILTNSSLGGTSTSGTAESASQCNSNFKTITGISASVGCSVANLEGCAGSTICSDALSQLGVPYCYAGIAVPRGQQIPVACLNNYNNICENCNRAEPLSGVFDCYALVDWAIAQALGLTSVDLKPSDISSPFDSPLITRIQQSQTVPGDIIFFDIPEDTGPQPGHIGICYNSGCTLMIDAANPSSYVNIDSVANFAPGGYCPNGGGIIDCVEGYAQVVGSTGNSAISRSGYYIDIGRLIPHGYYNVSGPTQQPDSVTQNQQQASWESNWNNYWQQTEKLQGASVYVIKSIPVENLNCGQSGCGMQKQAWINNNLMTRIHDNGFTPYNITVSDNGTVFLIGNFSISGNFSGVPTTPAISVPGIMRISNTSGKPQVYEKLLIFNPNNTDSSFRPGFGDPWAGQTGATINPRLTTFATPPVGQGFSEIAVSPDGQVVYLASPFNGTIQILDGSTLGLNGFYSLTFGDYAGGPSSSPPVANLSIYSYLADGGLYGIGTQKVPYLYNPPSDFNYPTLNESPTTHFDKTLGAMLNGFNNASEGGYITDPSTDPGSDLAQYHHPLAISDVNGYLYVLDNWNDASFYIGQGQGSLGNCNGIKIWVPLSGTLGGSCGGVYFQILDLRVLNASGTDVPINPMPTSIYDLIVPPISTQGTAYRAQTFADSNVTSDPPYGWILAANISQEKGQPNDNYQNVSVCGSAACKYNPVNLYSEYNYTGAYEPIGSQLINWVSHVASATPQMASVGLTTSGDGQVTVLLPNPATTNPDPAGNNPHVWSGWFHAPPNSNGPYKVSNAQPELIFATLSPENYTNTVASYPPYTCYAMDQNMTGSNGAGCISLGKNNSLVGNLSEPIAQLVDPLKTLENIGSFRSISIPSIFATSGANQQGKTSNFSQQVSSNKDCAEAIASGKQIPSGCLAANFGSSTYNASGVIGTNSTGIPFAIASTLNSTINGYLVVPYEYSVSTSTDYTPEGGGGPSCPSPSSIFQNKDNVQSGTLYGYALAQVKSNSNVAQVESGSTYLQNPNGQYYVPALSNSNTILPMAELFNVFTNRVFGSEWLNVTRNYTTDRQVILNALQWLQYRVNTYGQGVGGYPAYETISSNLTLPQKLGPQYAPSNLTNRSNIQNPVKTGYGYYQIQGPGSVNLFNWYQAFVYGSALNFLVAKDTYNYTYGGQVHTASMLGYQRIIYALSDEFNNTIYAPVDADIARVTRINLTVTPNVNTTNQNQTVLNISGKVGFTEINGTFIPLNKSHIYVYYDANLNYLIRTISKSGVVSITQANATQASRCAFAGTPLQKAGCILANPLSSNPLEDSVANTTTYYTQNTTVSGSPHNYVDGLPDCPSPPTSLLTPPNLNCNIYQNSGTVDNTSLPDKGTTPTGSKWYGMSCPSGPPQEYCVPFYPNGTGTCTSQVGLIEVARTNATGRFNITNVSDKSMPYGVVACGNEAATLYARFYGYPPPEPITVQQNVLPYARYTNGSQPFNFGNGGLLNTTTEFSALNYYWTPNETAVGMEIGLLLLNYGDITYAVIIAAGATAVILMLYSRKTQVFSTIKKTAAGRRRA